MIRYARIPNPPNRTHSTQISLTNPADMSKRSAIPAHTPAIILFSDLFSCAIIIDLVTLLCHKDTKNLRKNGRMRAKCDKWLVLIPFLCYPTIFLISAEIAVYGGY